MSFKIPAQGQNKRGKIAINLKFFFANSTGIRNKGYTTEKKQYRDGYGFYLFDAHAYDSDSDGIGVHGVRFERNGYGGNGDGR
jgi:hypothetical protein